MVLGLRFRRWLGRAYCAVELIGVRFSLPNFWSSRLVHGHTIGIEGRLHYSIVPLPLAALVALPSLELSMVLLFWQSAVIHVCDMSWRSGLCLIPHGFNASELSPSKDLLAWHFQLTRRTLRRQQMWDEYNFLICHLYRSAVMQERQEHNISVSTYFGLDCYALLMPYSCLEAPECLSLLKRYRRESHHSDCLRSLCSCLKARSHRPNIVGAFLER